MSQTNYLSVHWFHANNSRKNTIGNPLGDINFSLDRYYGGNVTEKADKDKPENPLVELLYNGWNDKPVVVLTLENYAKLHSNKDKQLTVADVIELVRADRAYMVQQWREVGYKDVANTMEKLWATCEVKYIGNECFRRSLGIAGVLTKRESDPKAQGKPFMLPIEVKNFGTTLERIIAHAHENTLKDASRAKYSSLDFYYLATLIVSQYGTEADLIRAMGGVTKALFDKYRGTAQKLYALAKLAEKYPELNINERVYMPAPETGDIEYSRTGYLPIAKLGKEELRNLLGGYEPGHKGKKEGGAIFSGKKIESYFSAVVSGKEIQRSMNGKDIATVLGDSPVVFLRCIAKAIELNDTGFFSRLKEYASELNSVCHDATVYAVGDNDKYGLENDKPIGWDKVETSTEDSVQENTKPSEQKNTKPSEQKNTKQATSPRGKK